MTPFMAYVTYISLAGLFVLLIITFIKHRSWKRFIAALVIIFVCIIFLNHFFFAREYITAKGKGDNDIYVVIVLYLFMLLGMLAQYLYNRFEQPLQQRPKFDFGTFIAPVFASPIVFIPLLAALQNADIDLQNLTTVKAMTFFVAFENGFFWKEYFDHRQKQKSEVTNG